MNFEELGTVSVKMVDECLIYFLINRNKVVYVGQTTKGLARPLSHKDKIFDRIEVLNCMYEALDDLEQHYILKYVPKYNNQLNAVITYGLNRVRNKVREETPLKQYTLRDLRKDLKKYEIKTQLDPIKNRTFIDREQADFLIDSLYDEYGWLDE